MKLKMLSPVAFGKFHKDTPIILEDGLNIIRGDNEAGKSTLGAFILGMFYGFKKEGKTRISRTPEFDRYRPWSGKDYRGSIVYEDGGRTYRVERSFDPDWVRVYDDATGEDITRSFSQDSRKEYDFALRHLGLSSKEFRNTVWIGQLGSLQEPGLGTEIQGKLESILEGGDLDVSLGRALAALGEERAKIKSPRSTRAELDLVTQRIEGLENELRGAGAREEQLRQDITEASDLGRERARLQSEIGRGENGLKAARHSFLTSILTQVQELEGEALSLKERAMALEWAGDLDLCCEESFGALRNERSSLEKRIGEIRQEAGDLDERVRAARSRLESMSRIDSAGTDEASISALHAKYLSAKAQTSRGERAANDARRDLRTIEAEGSQRDYPPVDFDEDILRKAEDYHETCLLAEKEKDRLEIGVERARAEVAHLAPGGASALIYAVALVALGLAVVCTVMAVPAGIPLFLASVVIFGYGVYRQRLAMGARRSAQESLSQREHEVSEQIKRIEDAREVLSQFLATLGVSSVDELRSRAREIASYRSRLSAAKDRFEQAQTAWFEASSGLSAVEKELLAVLRTSGVVQLSEPVSDAAVSSLRRGLRDLQSQKNVLKALEERHREVSRLLAQQEALLEDADGREQELFAAAGVSSGQELAEKIAAAKELKDLTRTLQEIDGRAEALLSGRNVPDINEELSILALEIGAVPSAGPVVADRDYEAMRRAQDEKKARLAEVNVRLAGLEKGIRLRSEEGRPSSVVEEELERERALEEVLRHEYDAVDLAYETLRGLSVGIRREFAPVLNKRVGEFLDSITGGRYAQVRVSPDLEMSVIHPETGAKTPVDALSGGTLDQCCFALRLAIALSVTRKETIPFFLDDSFVQYDDDRLKGALSVLGRLAERHQILIFSCHGREEEVARTTGLRYNRVAL